MKKFLLNALSVLTTVFLTVTAIFAQAAKPAATAPVKTTAAANETAHALLYKISGKNLKKPSYVFGTIHIICPNDMFSMEKLSGYLDQTDQLVMELDMDNTAEMQAMGAGLVMPDGKTLKDFLNAEQFAKVDEMFKNYMGMSAENVKQVKPAFLAIMLAASPKVLGCAPGSYEKSLLEAAVAKKKGVEGLETTASQFAVFDKMPLEKQAKDLYEMAANPQKSFDQFKALIATYKQQNSDALYETINAQAGDDKEFKTNLLDNRNIDWVPKLEKAMTERASFIAVGGGHLGGKKGVLNLLREKGYKIEAIKL